MKYCSECGNKLIKKECGIDGLIPYCPICKEYHFELFNSAISTILFNSDKDKILLIKQYQRDANILVAGYINKGENAKETLIREVKEEVNLDVVKYEYNDNVYYQKSNTLIHNYIAYVKQDNFQITEEVDDANWFTIDEAIHAILPKSLAKEFLFKALIKLGYTKKLFRYEEERIYMLDSNDELIAEIIFQLNDGVYHFNHTFVDKSLKGMGIGNTLMEEAYEYIKNKNAKASASCSFVVHYLEKNPEKNDLFQ